jgi:hypothetical protein
MRIMVDGRWWWLLVKKKGKGEGRRRETVLVDLQAVVDEVVAIWG